MHERTRSAALSIRPGGRLTVTAFALLTLMLSAPLASAAQGQLPRRVISLAPSVTREIVDLGAQDLLVGVTSYCPVPEGSTAQIVGTPGRISIEKAFFLKPDLILASTDCSGKADVAVLKRLGCTIHVFSGCENFACMCTSFRELGALLGRAERADTLVRDIRARLNEIESGIKGRKRPKVFWQLGASPLVTASDATFAGEFLRRAGAVNIFGDALMRYPRVNTEEVLRRNPDIIIVVSQMEPGTGTSAWTKFKGMAAVKNGRVHELNADLVCQPTPSMFVRGLEAVVAVLYPEVP